MMEELQIAKAEAEILHRLSNWRRYSTFDGSYDPRMTVNGKPDPDPEEIQLAELEARKHELARLQAGATKRDFETVLAEVELEVMTQLARILAKTIDPVLVGLKSVAIQESGEVCGVCQEEMEVGEEGRAMECMHKFHTHCIEKWLRRKKTCPLCRYKMEIKEYDF